MMRTKQHARGSRPRPPADKAPPRSTTSNASTVSTGSSHTLSSSSGSLERGRRGGRATGALPPPPRARATPSAKNWSIRDGRGDEDEAPWSWQRNIAGGVSLECGNETRPVRSAAAAGEGQGANIYSQFEEFGQKLDAEVADLERLVVTNTNAQERSEHAHETEGEANGRPGRAFDFQQEATFQPQISCEAPSSASTSEETASISSTGDSPGSVPSPSGLSSSLFSPPKFTRPSRAPSVTDCNASNHGPSDKESLTTLNDYLDNNSDLDGTIHSLDSGDLTNFSSATVQAAIAAAREMGAVSAIPKECMVQKMQMQTFLDEEYDEEYYDEYDQQQDQSLEVLQADSTASTLIGEEYDVEQQQLCERTRKMDGVQLDPCAPRSLSDETAQPRQDHQYRPPTTQKHEMLIHPSSVDGTTAAAAWHLHGQTGGRRTASRSVNPGNVGKENCSVMNARAIADSLKGKGDELHETDDCEDYLDGISNVRIDSEEGITTLSATSAPLLAKNSIDQDVWSTGIAAAIVTGAASRHHQSFFLFPHGRRILLPILMGALATALSLATLLSCQFMTILPRVDDFGGGNVGNRHQEVFQVGPWGYLSVNPSYSDGEVCLAYPSGMPLDTPFLVARSASTLAAGLGGALVLLTCTLACIPTGRRSANSLGLCFFLAGALQCLTATFYRSENCGFGNGDGDVGGGGYFGGGECRPNQDLVFCVAAAVLYMATGWILRLSHKFTSDGRTNAGDKPSSYEDSMEVYTWSSEARSSDPERGVLRTVEKCWTRVPNGSTLAATVYVERREDVKDEGGGGGGIGRMKTTYSIHTEILPP